MSRLKAWKKRLRILGDKKPTVQVQTTDQLETMTATQEQRFRQLQRVRVEEHRRSANRPWYTLADACNRLATTPDSLLQAAAEGSITCYVASNGLLGRWDAGGDSGGRAGHADVSHLRLTRAACREAATDGGVEVTVLCHPTANVRGARFLLDKPLWVAPERILLKHPLPAPRS